MNTIGIALVWCVLQVTLVGLLASSLYVLVHRLRPAVAATVVLSGLTMVVILSLLVMSPWPRWEIRGAAQQQTAATAIGRLSSGGDSGPAMNSPATPANALPSSSADRPVTSKTGSPSNMLLNELSQPRAMAAAGGWDWPAAVAAVLLGAVTCGLGWLALGMTAVSRLRLRSRPLIDNSLLVLVDALRAQIGCRRPVEVRQCADLLTAATIGWLRPVLLLPADWTDWTADQRRAVLAHEIAHAGNHDFLALLGGQLALVLHFYHPLVHWLVNRLRLEQEFAADAAAARVSGGQQQYLMTIAELALRPPPRPLMWPASSFLPTRTTFLRRIDMLRDPKLRFDRLSPISRVLAAGVVVACGLMAAGLRGPENQHQAYAADPAAAPPASSTTADNQDGIDWSLVPAKAVFVAAARPATIFRRPELVAYGKLLDETPNSVKTTEIEQVTVAAFELPAVPNKPRSGPLSYSDIMNTRPNWVIIYQMTKPCPFADFLRETRDVEKREYRGKTYLYDVRWPLNSTPRLRLDARTLVIASSEDAVRIYIQTIELGKDHLGRPKFIDTDQWRAFQSDQMVVATKARTVEESIKLQEWILGKPDPFLAPIPPLWQETTQGMAGIRFGDEVKVHAILIGRNLEAAEKVEKVVEAARLLAVTALRALTVQSLRGQPLITQWGTESLGRILAATRTQREGAVVGLRGAVSMASVTKALPPVAAARQGFQLGQARNNMRMLALAMLNYNNVYKHFPPAVLYGPDGTTPYSWRVAVLPFLEEEALYKQYHFDEPWDGPNNRKLLEKMPAVFRSPTEAAGSNSTNASYFVLVGPGTIFDGKKGTDLREITDGLSHTILLVEAKRDIPWTKPEDIPYSPDKPLPELGGYFAGVFNTAFADASVRGLPSSIGEKVLRPLITKADGQVVETPPDAP